MRFFPGTAAVRTLGVALLLTAAGLLREGKRAHALECGDVLEALLAMSEWYELPGDEPESERWKKALDANAKASGRINSCIGERPLPRGPCGAGRARDVLSRLSRNKGPTIAPYDPSKFPFPRILTVDPKVVSYLSKVTDPAVKDEDITVLTDALRKSYPGATVIQFKGSFRNPDATSSLGRLLIHLPGRDYDSFLQIGRDAHFGANGVRASNLSQISVQKRAPNGKPLARPVLFYGDHDIVYSNGPPAGIRRIAPADKRLDCDRCHNGSVFPVLSPDFTPISHARGVDGSTLRERLNRVILDYGRTVSYNAEKADPLAVNFGNATPSEAFLKECAPSLGDEARGRVGRNMNCLACHDGRHRNIIRSMPEDVLARLLVDSDHMVQFDRLDRPEKEALASCLRRDHKRRQKALEAAHFRKDLLRPCLESQRNACVREGSTLVFERWSRESDGILEQLDAGIRE